MSEDCCFLNKDALIVKAPKKSPLALRMVVLSVVMICGVYICSICLKQIGTQPNPRLMRAELVDIPCRDPRIPESELPYVHYPEPISYSRDECACTPVRLFVIVSMQRSGSGWFETLLNSHVNVSSHGEVFSNKERRSNMSSITKTLEKLYNLDWNSSASKNECTAAVGLKWMLNQGLVAHHKEIVEYFNRRGVSVIVLFRRNLLRRFVSILANSHDRDAKQLNGTHKAHVHSRNEADVLARFKPLINATDLIPSLSHMDRGSADALDYFKNTHHMLLYYEDLVSNHTKLIDVLEFLKLPPRKLFSRHVKIHTKPLSQQVENWDTIYNTLKGTQYERFLTADYQ
ncbi:LOW QUALITY PROTEIN: nodulation protein H-like [Dioscorea cayenensis subsp. rotundata]|uniref:Sulfotransferase n=1 Tax=Dioscorea cayennensis subsp. rotundata TaxID=55577 RepID=A0AB40BLI1_DIOCR|nr:LOW QUALITY PROTEIN: nodulation protein H-like [Dioscorea cayenensis subsp. rotundata]